MHKSLSSPIPPLMPPWRFAIPGIPSFSLTSKSFGGTFSKVHSFLVSLTTSVGCYFTYICKVYERYLSGSIITCLSSSSSYGVLIMMILLSKQSSNFIWSLWVQGSNLRRRRCTYITCFNMKIPVPPDPIKLKSRNKSAI